MMKLNGLVSVCAALAMVGCSGSGGGSSTSSSGGSNGGSTGGGSQTCTGTVSGDGVSTGNVFGCAVEAVSGSGTTTINLTAADDSTLGTDGGWDSVFSIATTQSSVMNGTISGTGSNVTAWDGAASYGGLGPNAVSCSGGGTMGTLSVDVTGEATTDNSFYTVSGTATQTMTCTLTSDGGSSSITVAYTFHD